MTGTIFPGRKEKIWKKKKKKKKHEGRVRIATRARGILSNFGTERARYDEPLIDSTRGKRLLHRLHANDLTRRHSTKRETMQNEGCGWIT